MTGITHFCSRSALDVESIGSSGAEALRSSGLASSALDLFSLTTDQLANLNLGTPEEPRRYGAVSYTHLDVYKRQAHGKAHGV